MLNEIEMNITRRGLAMGGISLLASASMSTLSRAELGSFLGIGEGLEDFLLATDAYIYGYPLVTMEMTRRVITNVADAGGHARPDGSDRQAAPISQCRPSATSPRPTPTRSTPRRSSMSAKSPRCSASPT